MEYVLLIQYMGSTVIPQRPCEDLCFVPALKLDELRVGQERAANGVIGIGRDSTTEVPGNDVISDNIGK